jgi:hypothetical protein
MCTTTGRNGAGSQLYRQNWCDTATSSQSPSDLYIPLQHLHPLSPIKIRRTHLSPGVSQSGRFSKKWCVNGTAPTARVAARRPATPTKMPTALPHRTMSKRSPSSGGASNAVAACSVLRIARRPYCSCVPDGRRAKCGIAVSAGSAPGLLLSATPSASEKTASFVYAWLSGRRSLACRRSRYLEKGSTAASWSPGMLVLFDERYHGVVERLVRVWLRLG